MAGEILTAERLRELLDYDPDTGAFKWRVRLSNRVSIGSVAGAYNSHTGYTSISIDRRLHRAHRLAWLHVTGSWPEGPIDHVNGQRSDNRWSNLRAATTSLNQQNLREARGDTNSGLLGVYRTDKKQHPWRAAIGHMGKSQHLGNYATKREAQRAYLRAKRRLHEGCTI